MPDVSPLRLLAFAHLDGSDGPAPDGPAAARMALAAWRSAGAAIWLDAEAPSPTELAALATSLDLEPFPALPASTAGMAARPRPWLARYGATTFLRLYVPRPGTLSGTSGASLVVPGGLTPLDPLFIYAGQRYLLTVHDRPLPLLEGVADRARATPGAPGAPGAPAGPPSTVALLHDVLIALLDAYGEVVDHLAEMAESREAAAYGAGSSAQRARRGLDRIRHDLFALRRLATAQRSALALLARGQALAPGGAGDAPAFEDVLDRAVRLEQAVAVQHGLLISARAAHHAWIAAALTRVIRTLLVLTCLLAVPTLVTNVYGMNFERLPELAFPLGHLWAIAVAVVLDGALWLFFRRRGWV